jgi:hypothetical protein
MTELKLLLMILRSEKSKISIGKNETVWITYFQAGRRKAEIITFGKVEL